MKSMKTLIISAAVCGTMALPLSGAADDGTAAPQGKDFTALQEHFIDLNCGSLTDANPKCEEIAAKLQEHGVDP